MEKDCKSTAGYSLSYANPWKLNNILLNDEWILEETQKEIKQFLESNENENTTHQNV